MRECPSCRRCFADMVGACPDDGRPTAQTLAGDPLIDRYRLERRLGHGGMGIVYDARHAYLRTRHALKVILPDPHADEEKLAKLVRRFSHEALVIAAIKHPNVVNITDSGVTSGAMPFLVMEFIEGVSLEKMLEGGKAFAPARALNILRPVAAGVGAAHRRGIVHRDLKPANIMIADGAPMEVAVKVLDFGLAKVLARDVLGSLTLDQSGGIIGTPLYLAPEQCRGQETDARTDVYALGVIAYQMIAGRLPFNAATLMGVIELHREADPPPMSSNSVVVPPRVEAAVRRALSKDPAARPPSVQAFIDELSTAVAHEQAIQLADTLPSDVKAHAPTSPAVTTPLPTKVISSPLPPKTSDDARPPSPVTRRARLPWDLRFGDWLSRARPTTVALLFILAITVVNFFAMLTERLSEYLSRPTINYNSAPAPTNDNREPAPTPGLAAWRVRKVLTGYTHPVKSVAFSPDGKTLYSGGDQVKVKAWDAQSGAELLPFDTVPYTRFLFALDVSRDGEYVLAATDKGVVAWDARTRKFHARLSDHDGWRTSFAVSPDGRLLASVGDAEVVVSSALGLPEAVLMRKQVQWGMQCVAFSPNTQAVGYGGLDNTIYLDMLDGNGAIKTLTGHRSLIRALAFSPDGRTLASGDMGGTIILWDWQTGKRLRPLQSHGVITNALAFSPDGKTLAGGGGEYAVALWNVNTGILEQTLPQHTGEITSVAFSPDGKLLASASEDKTIVLWELALNASPQR